jgi:hypothetical protein
MKKAALAIVLLLSFATLRAEPEFVGFMIRAQIPVFLLSVGQEKTSAWLSIGQSFDGFQIVAFDPRSDLLVIEKEGKRQEIRLQQSHILESQPEDPKERLRPLEGLTLAYAIARGGDKEMIDLLTRYQQALTALQSGPTDSRAATGTISAEKFLAQLIEQKAAQKKAQILNESEKPPPQTPPPTPPSRGGAN